MTASGEWVNDFTHGKQFKAHFLRCSAPTSIEGIEKYLGSGMIRGVGPVYARKLVKAFGDLTGCYVLINTSFNVRGEPIVCTPKEAYTCFRRTNMDYLCLGPYLLDKSGQKPWKDEDDWKTDFELD